MSLSETARTPLRYLNDTLKGWALHTQEYFRLLARSLRGSVSRPFYRRDLVIQMDAIGVGSVGIVLLTGLFTGMVLALQSAVEQEVQQFTRVTMTARHGVTHLELSLGFMRRWRSFATAG